MDRIIDELELKLYEALEIIKKNRSYYSSKSVHPLFVLKGVDELDFSVRAINALKHLNVKTVGELVQKKEEELLITKNFGRKALKEVKEKLAENGLYLGMKIP